MPSEYDRSIIETIPLWKIVRIKLFLLLLGTSNAFGMNTKWNLKPTKYTEWSKNVTYLSTTKYNARGMKPLYDITKKVMWLLIGREDPIPDGYLELNDLNIQFGPKVERNEWGDLVLHYWLILSIVLLVASMPIIGLCFCWCRCSGTCAGPSQPFNKKHDTCRSIFLSFLLILLSTGILFGIVVSFATNSYMQYGIDESTSVVRTGSSDTQKFLSATSEQLEYVLVNNYKQLTDQLEVELRETSDFIITQLEQKSVALSVEYLTEFVKKLPDIKQKLQTMKVITNDILVYNSQLSDGLPDVELDLLVILNKCSHQFCKDVLKIYEIFKEDANGIHYDQLYDVTSITENLDRIISDDITSAGELGHNDLKAMPNHLNYTIAKYTPQLINVITKAGEGLQTAANNIKNELNKVSKIIDTITRKYSNKVDNYLVKYGPYRFYMGIGISSILLLVLICLVAALLCDICGKRPHGYGDDSCNKGPGSRFHKIAVAFIFLTIYVITLIAIIYFLIGIVAYRAVCVPLRDPENDAIFAELDSLVDLNEVFHQPKMKDKAISDTLPPFRISRVIAACQVNQTIYKVLNINNLIDINEISEYPSHYNLNQALENLVQGIDFDDRDVKILCAADKQRILRLRESALKTFDSFQCIDNLNDNITQHFLTEIANQLLETAKKCIQNTDVKYSQMSLHNKTLYLEAYAQNIVIPMQNKLSELVKLAHDLAKILRYKDRPFLDSILLLVQEMEEAQLFIQKDERAFVKATAKGFTKHFSSEIIRYLTMVVTSVEKKIGICAPMANVYEAVVVATCNSIVDPLNGFWAGVLWCVLLFLPTLIVAVKLSTLLSMDQKSDLHTDSVVESENLP